MLFFVKFYGFKVSLTQPNAMLNFNTTGNIKDGPVDPNDPNSPVIPNNGVNPSDDNFDIEAHPTEIELQATRGALIRGSVGNELSSALSLELQNRGLTAELVASMAAKWGVSMAQSAAICLTRSVSNQLNRTFASNFGGFGGNGAPPAITFLPANSSDGGSGPGGPGGGGPRGPEYGLAHHPWLQNHLDTNGKPGEVLLNVGIKAKGYVPYFKEPSSSFTSPLHITCAIPQMPTDTDYSVGRFNVSSILLRFIERVSRSVNYQLDPNTFNSTNVNAYFNNILKGLAYYYWYESIYAYSMSKADTNDALVALRRSMTADTLNNLMILRSTLASLPIPPNMVQFVYWMYQNWQVHSLGDSPVIKVCPFPIDAITKLPDPAALITLNDTLVSSTNRSITSTLVKAFDEWYKMDLPPSSITLEHCADFTTLWANLPCRMSDTAASPSYGHYQPTSANEQTPASYVSFTDELEGGIQAMFAIYDSSRGKWAPSLVSPVVSAWASKECNRFSWISSSAKFDSPFGYPILSIQRPDSILITPAMSGNGVSLSGANAIHSPFAERVYSININTVCEVSTEFLRWLLNFDNITEFSGSAGDVMRSAPRGNALNANRTSGKPNNPKPSFVRNKVNKQSPAISKALDDMTGGEL